MHDLLSSYLWNLRMQRKYRAHGSHTIPKSAELTYPNTGVLWLLSLPAITGLPTSNGDKASCDRVASLFASCSSTCYETGLFALNIPLALRAWCRRPGAPPPCFLPYRRSSRVSLLRRTCERSSFTCLDKKFKR